MRRGNKRGAAVAALAAFGAAVLLTCAPSVALADSSGGSGANGGVSVAGIDISCPLQQGDITAPTGPGGSPGQAYSIASLPPSTYGQAASQGLQGYWITGTQGTAPGGPTPGQNFICNYGYAPWYGTNYYSDDLPPAAQVVSTPDGHGYWLVDTSGDISAYGDAASLPDPGQCDNSGCNDVPAGTVIVGAASDVDGQGLWLLASSGETYGVGDAPAEAPETASSDPHSSGATAVAIVASPTANAYDVVYQDGCALAFGQGAPVSSTTGPQGDCGTYGLSGQSAEGLFGGSIVAATYGTSGGVVMVSNNRYVCALGSAVGYDDSNDQWTEGCQPYSQSAPEDAVSIASSPPAGTTDSSGQDETGGYWILASSGQVTSYGSAQFAGDAAGDTVNGTGYEVEAPPSEGSTLSGLQSNCQPVYQQASRQYDTSVSLLDAQGNWDAWGSWGGTSPTALGSGFVPWPNAPYIDANSSDPASALLVAGEGGYYAPVTQLQGGANLVYNSTYDSDPNGDIGASMPQMVGVDTNGGAPVLDSSSSQWQLDAPGDANPSWFNIAEPTTSDVSYPDYGVTSVDTFAGTAALGSDQEPPSASVVNPGTPGSQQGVAWSYTSGLSQPTDTMNAATTTSFAVPTIMCGQSGIATSDSCSQGAQSFGGTGWIVPSDPTCIDGEPNSISVPNQQSVTVDVEVSLDIPDVAYAAGDVSTMSATAAGATGTCTPSASSVWPSVLTAICQFTVTNPFGPQGGTVDVQPTITYTLGQPGSSTEAASGSRTVELDAALRPENATLDDSSDSQSMEMPGCQVGFQGSTVTTMAAPTANATTLGQSGSTYEARNGDSVTLSATTAPSQGSSPQLIGDSTAQLALVDTTSGTTLKVCKLGSNDESSLTCTTTVSLQNATHDYEGEFTDSSGTDPASSSSPIAVQWVGPVSTSVTLTPNPTSPGVAAPVTLTSTAQPIPLQGGTPNGNSNSDPRANGYTGNVTTCSAIGLSSDTQLSGNDANASDSYYSGTVATNAGTTQPGQGQELDVTQLQSGMVIDAIVVKGGNGYNEYTNSAFLPPTLASPQHYISPLNGGGNVPAISHWFICYHAGSPPTTSPPAGTITITLNAASTNVTGGLQCVIGETNCTVSVVSGQQTVTCTNATSCQAIEAPQAPGTSATFSTLYTPGNSPDPAVPYYATSTATATVTWASSGYWGGGANGSTGTGSGGYLPT